ncbi:MAG: sensor histidine kinase [Flavobacteriales bacterium]
MVSVKAMRYLPQVERLLRCLSPATTRTLQRHHDFLNASYQYRMGYQMKFRRNFPEALRYFQTSWTLMEGLGYSTASNIEAIGVLYESVGEQGLAMRHYEMALASCLQYEPADPFGEGSIRRHIASLLMDQGRFTSADPVLAACDTTIIDLRILVHAHRARKALLLGDSAAAEAGYMNTLELLAPASDDWAKIDLLTPLIRLRSARGDHQGALNAALSCIEVADRTGDESAWCTCMILAGKSQYALGHAAMAEKRLKAALDTARAYGYHGLARMTGDEGSMVEAAATLRDIYLEQNRLVDAVRMTTYWSELKDTLNMRDGRLDVLRDRMQEAARMDSTRSAIALSHVRSEKAQADREVQQQRNRTLLALALAAALALIALLLYRSMRNKQRLAKKEKELHDEQVDQLLSQQEMKSINAMLEGQEQERERVSKELHDHVGHLLGTIKHQLGELEEQVADVKSEQTVQYKRVTGLLDNAAGELRRISHDMAAATLNRFGLEKALKDLRDTIHINGRLQVELNTFGLEKPLERGVEIAVYRIVQEAVSNVLKHAQASELSIAVTHAPGRLSVLVGDNGTGFDTNATSSGVGLTNIRSRAAALGAQVQIDSAPGKGTTVSVECPVVE